MMANEVTAAEERLSQGCQRASRVSQTEFEYRIRVTEEGQGRDPFQEEGGHFQESVQGADSRAKTCVSQGKIWGHLVL